MKVTSEKAAETFKPFKLVLEIETLEEASQLYALANHSRLIDLTPALEQDKIRDAIAKAAGRIPPYDQTHAKLTAIIR